MATVHAPRCAFQYAGCTDPLAANFMADATVSLSSACTFARYGCTVPAAVNFDSYATVDDGRCRLAGQGSWTLEQTASHATADSAVPVVGLVAACDVAGVLVAAVAICRRRHTPAGKALAAMEHSARVELETFESEQRRVGPAAPLAGARWNKGDGVGRAESSGAMFVTHL